ncbi:hypothetical protein [Peristeroidobacter agariperforans]|uniref:hypothetical protein n=1 Tax=Peristeroidobacter agariperforans TaxID=268404 RepID=UPI00101D5DB7|nr:hypothetical protein [Peristeroidobacter agariperforans]
MKKNAAIQKYLIAVGKLVQDSTASEIVLALTLQVFAQLDSKLTHAIFFTIDALSTRKKLINRVLEVVPHDSTDKQLVETIIRNVEIVQNKRNDLAHSMALISDDADQRQIALKPKALTQRHKPITTPMIDAALRESRIALTKAMSAYIQLCEKRQVQPAVILK